jgi:pimeloyl-ACP methyl ester carboxylesterase
VDRSSVQVEQIRPRLDGRTLADLRARLTTARFMPHGDDGWEQGVPRDWLAQLVREWHSFDQAALQSRLDGLTHQRAILGGTELHLVHLPGQGPEPLPLLLTHGWPGSFLEYLDLLPLLTDPGSHGGDPADSFTVVVPSLPGYGFSGPPPTAGLSPAAVAGLWHQLMRDGLGYERYVAHGGDLGAGVTAWLARAHPEAVAGIHLATPGLAVPPGPRSPAEERYQAEVAAWTAQEGGYAHEQATKPLTLAAALGDSPVGLAAWIGEKVRSWSPAAADTRPATRGFLLATLSLYWATATISTSLLPYWAYRHQPATELPADGPPPAPTAVSNFGGEQVPFPKPPRALAARYFSLSAWAEHDRGGHFPAVHEPALLAATLRDVFRPLRGPRP